RRVLGDRRAQLFEEVRVLRSLGEGRPLDRDDPLANGPQVRYPHEGPLGARAHVDEHGIGLRAQTLPRRFRVEVSRMIHVPRLCATGRARRRGRAPPSPPQNRMSMPSWTSQAVMRKRARQPMVMTPMRIVAETRLTPAATTTTASGGKPMPELLRMTSGPSRGRSRTSIIALLHSVSLSRTRRQTVAGPSSGSVRGPLASLISRRLLIASAPLAAATKWVILPMTRPPVIAETCSTHMSGKITGAATA